MFFPATSFCTFFRGPLTLYWWVVTMGGEKLKWHQLAHHQLMSKTKDVVLVHTVQLKTRRSVEHGTRALTALG